MRRVLPPLNPLRMFEAAARHVSFTHAAEEFGVTQSAVSRQVAVLEAFLKVRLFERRNSELILTDTGHAYLEAVQPAFEMISQATETTRGQVPNVIKLRVYLTFGMRWLLPRLPRFRALHPKIGINITTTVGPVDFEREDVDVSICHGDGAFPGVRSWQIFSDKVTPVFSPTLLPGGENIKQLSDMAGQTLLHSRNRISDWPDWMASAGLDGDSKAGLVFETSSLVYEAARQGIGVAIGQTRLLETELARGELVAPFPVMERQGGYYLLHRAGRTEARIHAFREWVLNEVARDGKEGLAA